MARPRRILFAGLALPFPPMSGHRLRTWAMLRALAAEGHEVTLVSFAEPHELDGNRALREVCPVVELVPLPGRTSAALEPLARLGALAAPLPYAAWRLRSPALTRALEGQLARARFDALICDGIYNVQNLPDRLAVPILLNKDDVAHMILQRYLALERHPIRRLYGAIEAWKVMRWERRACTRVAAVLACSDVDRRLLRALCPRAPIFVVPNVVDTGHYAPATDPEPSTVLFQGGIDWYPNRDAVEFFVGAILPALRRLVRGVRFRVAGRGSAEAFRRRFADQPDVEFAGSVPDMRAEIARAAVCVVPLRIGSGTRLKILEAAAMGKPIVSTTLGAEGLAFVPGLDIVLADDPARFTAEVAALLRDPARRRALGEAARARVEVHYSLTVLKRCLSQALSDLPEPLATAFAGPPSMNGQPVDRP